ncbi:MAG TPA: ribokinase [Candidatus Limnocylindria bacterium]|nr:ribokinase [Candidatus Limnocylindria bacterium]
MGRVIVVGSINVDLVVTADRLPAPGETVLGGRFAQHHGGKGANAAVAAARAGASVTMLGAVGRDAFGEVALEALSAEGIELTRIRRVDEPTGVALIAVGPRGENQIVVAPGANAELRPEDLGLDGLAGRGAVLLANLEIPMPTVTAALRTAAEAGARTILDPAPARALPSDVLAIGAILTPNEHELTVSIGNDDPVSALAELTQRHRGAVIVTQGPAGALLAHGDVRSRSPGFVAPRVVDTTGAGDTFAGVLAACLAEGRDLDDAITMANGAGALAVGAPGARQGMPSRGELDSFLATAERALSEED